MQTPVEFAKNFQVRWESAKVSMDTDDNGNFFKGVLIGSKYGVTGAALASYRKVGSITREDMAALTLDEAAEVFLKLYYRDPHFDLLPWNRVTASIVDFGWGTGPAQAIKCLQRVLDAPTVDGVLTPKGFTITKYTNMTRVQGEVFMAGVWWAVRDAFYELVIDKNAAKAKYEKGWDNRSAYFTPGHSESWWTDWDAAKLI